MQTITRGDAGAGVAEIRAALAELGYLSELEYLADVSPEFDNRCERATRAFQQVRGLVADGVVGPETWNALLAARYRLGDRVLSFSVSSPMIGDDVLTVQERLLEMGYDVVYVDGIFGIHTHEAVRMFQRECGLNVDGIVGPETTRAFARLARKVVGGQPLLLRETALLDRDGHRFSGKHLVIDPGSGETTEHGSEGEVCYDIASRIEGRIVAMGGRASLTRSPSMTPSTEERALFANRVGANLLISLHCNSHPNPAANGLATYHYGASPDSCSTRGARLAGLAHREILARTHMTDCRIHAKTWEILRLSRMPAVHIELGYLSNRDDRARLETPRFRDTVAEAVVVAIQRAFLPLDTKVHTGTLNLDALRELQV